MRCLVAGDADFRREDCTFEGKGIDEVVVAAAAAAVGEGMIIPFCEGCLEKEEKAVGIVRLTEGVHTSYRDDDPLDDVVEEAERGFRMSDAMDSRIKCLSASSLRFYFYFSITSYTLTDTFPAGSVAVFRGGDTDTQRTPPIVDSTDWRGTRWRVELNLMGEGGQRTSECGWVGWRVTLGSSR